jgi:NADPH-dependent 7-cyano-7-deazaguanine reductase QueF
VFGETFTNLLADDLWAALNPTWLKVETEWAPRGGISIRARTCRPARASTGESGSLGAEGPVAPDR